MPDRNRNRHRRWETWHVAEKREWSEGIENTNIVVGNPLTDCKDSIAQLVLLEPTDESMDYSIQRLYRNKYPKLVDIKET